VKSVLSILIFTTTLTFSFSAFAIEGYTLYEGGVISFTDIKKNSRYKPYQRKNFRQFSHPRLNSQYSYSDFKNKIYYYSKKHSVEPSLIRAIIEVESGYNPFALSPKGAIGLMQLMPQTAQELNVDPWNPTENIEGGTRYFKKLSEKYHHDISLALAAYNAGWKNVEKYGGVPPFNETIAYVSKVKLLHRKYKRKMFSLNELLNHQRFSETKRIKSKKRTVRTIQLSENSNPLFNPFKEFSMITKEILGDTIEFTNIYKKK